MRVKKYIVDTMPEAMKKIRDDLGKDAVILNQKEVKIGGIFGLFGTKKIEVVAAVDPNAQPPKPRVTTASVPQSVPVQIPMTQPAPPRQSPAPVQPIPTPQPGLNLNAAANAYGVPNMAAQPATRPQVESASTVAVPKQSPVAQAPTKEIDVKPKKEESVAVVATDDAAEQETPKDRKSEDSVLQEIRQMKEMMLKLSTTNLLAAKNPESIQKMIDHLESQEFDSTLIEELIFHVKNELETAGINNPEDEQVSALVREQLEKIVYSNGVETINPDTKIVHFVGPTGVGKTTTIAKLAARQVLDFKRKVGFITADTYRIAAVEQLRTYASILNAPIEVAMSPQDLARAFESMKDLDIIFMDTAGRNFRNEMYVSELNTMLNSSDKSETYLVLSMTMKYRDMKAITENFSRIRIDRFLFSKMDETATYGSIVNLIHRFSIPLSYFTHGQQVPNDIDEVKEDKFVDRLMGVQEHE